MSKGIWILVFVVLIVGLVFTLFLGPGLINPQGRFISELPNAPNISRTIEPASPTSGAEVKVTIKVIVGDADTYVIDEYVPTSWTLISKGTLDASEDQKRLTYSALGDAVNVSHYYIIKAPDPVGESYQFYGEYVYGSRRLGGMVNKKFVIEGIQTLKFTSILDITTNLQKNIFIDGQQAGIGTVSKQLNPNNYTVSFEEVSGYLKIDSKNVSALPGKRTVLSCYYQEKDLADLNADGDVSVSEIGQAVTWFKTTKKDPSGNTYDILKLLDTIERFFQGVNGGYYPKAKQCNTTLV